MSKPNIFAVHAQYLKSKKRNNGDVVLVKEVRQDANGNRVKDIRYFIDHKRPYYTTKPKWRDHKDKKSHEDIRRCDKHMTTDAGMVDSIRRTLRVKGRTVRQQADSPYLYWAQVPVTAIILNKYRDTFGEPEMLPDVAAMDFEWDIEDKRASIGTYGYENVVRLTIREDKIRSTGMTNDQFLRALMKGFEEHVLPMVDDFYGPDGKGASIPEEDRIKFVLKPEIVRLDIDVARKLFMYTHEDKPDYLTLWNGYTDFNTIFGMCEKYKVDPSEFMCDPTLPDEYRFTKLVMGEREAKKDAKGNNKKATPKNTWDYLINGASWMYVDMMLTYGGNRAHLPDLPSYGLEAVSDEDLNLKKLRLVKEVSTDDLGAWHKTMSNHHFLEYCLYACPDVIEPLLLEQLQYEIRGQLYPNMGISPVEVTKSTPTKLTYRTHFEMFKEGFVVGTVSSNMWTAIDRAIYDGDGWIIALNARYHDQMGVPVCGDAPSAGSLYVPHCDDEDLTNSYPMNQRMFNADKSTTLTEMAHIRGMTMEGGRLFGMNLSSGIQNAMLLATELGLPTLEEVYKQIVSGEISAVKKQQVE